MIASLDLTKIKFPVMAINGRDFIAANNPQCYRHMGTAVSSR